MEHYQQGSEAPREADIKTVNDLFKSDSPRVAFLLCVGLCDYSVMRKLGSSVGCPLSGRDKF